MPAQGLGSAAAQCLVAFDDDGLGPNPPALYVGGTFRLAGGAVVNGIAKWDGVSWQPLGVGLVGVPTSLAVYDDDGAGPHHAALIAAGPITAAGGHAVNRIARWDGASWSDMGTGVLAPLATTDGRIVMTIHDDDGPGPDLAYLYAGGEFGVSGGAVNASVARWTGSTWASVGLSPLSTVYALASFDEDGVDPIPPVLVAAGIGGNQVVRWNGAGWASLGTVTGFGVTALVTFDADGSGPGHPVLVARGGTFGGVSSLAQWNGSAWSSLPSNPAGIATPLLEFDPDGAGPLLPVLIGRITNNVFQLSGSAWSQLGPNFDDSVFAAAAVDFDGAGPTPPVLGVVGAFTAAGAVPANRAALWDGAAWSACGAGMTGPSAAQVESLAVFDDDGAGPRPPALYCGGRFQEAGGTVVKNIARWDGTAWSPLAQGLDRSVASLIEFDPDGTGPLTPVLVAGAGSWGTAGGFNMKNISQWNGLQWAALGQGLDGPVRALAVFDEDGSGPNPAALFAGGEFASAYVVSVPRIARWDGTAWSAVGLAAGTSPVRALAVFDDDGPGPQLPSLVAGGDFLSIGGVSARLVAQWTGIEWRALGAGLGGGLQVSALAVFDEDGPGPVPAALFAGGSFQNVGGNPANTVLNIARWNGAAWSEVGPGLSGGKVFALSVFDLDGTGPQPAALYATGSFTRTGAGASMPGIAAWDGASWSAIESGLVGSGLALTPFEQAGSPALVVGGSFTVAGSAIASGLSFLTCETFCYANCDGSTLAPILNVNDYICFLNRFNAGDPYSNCDNSTTAPTLNVNDFTCFMNRFAAGCQ